MIRSNFILFYKHFLPFNWNSSDKVNTWTTNKKHYKTTENTSGREKHPSKFFFTITYKLFRILNCKANINLQLNWLKITNGYSKIEPIRLKNVNTITKIFNEFCKSLWKMNIHSRDELKPKLPMKTKEFITPNMVNL